MDRPFVFMKRALLTFKAAGLHPPFLGPGEEDFWLQLWVERYGALAPDLFVGCVKRLAGERYFPRLHDMDAAVLDSDKKRVLSLRRQKERLEACHGPDLFDRENSRRRVRELIEHLERKFDPPYPVEKRNSSTGSCVHN